MSDEVTKQGDFTDLVLNFEQVIIASCNCVTKTPEVKYHDPLCYYRLLMEKQKCKKMDWKLKNAESQATDDFWYDLTDGGYIHLEQFIDDPEQLEAAYEAIDLLTDLRDVLIENELIEEI